MENKQTARSVPVQFADSDKKYMLRLLPARKNMASFSKFLSLVIPIISAGSESIMEYQSQMKEFTEMLENEDAPFAEAPKANLMDATFLLAQQLKEPAFLEIADELLGGLYNAVDINGEWKEISPVDLDNDFYKEDFALYLQILEHAVKVNFAVPFESWLKSKGLSEIGSSLQSMISAAIMPTVNK